VSAFRGRLRDAKTTTTQQIAAANRYGVLKLMLEEIDAGSQMATDIRDEMQRLASEMRGDVVTDGADLPTLFDRLRALKLLAETFDEDDPARAKVWAMIDALAARINTVSDASEDYATSNAEIERVRAKLRGEHRALEDDRRSRHIGASEQKRKHEASKSDAAWGDYLASLHVKGARK